MPNFPKAVVEDQGGVTQRATRSSDETMKTGDVVWGKVMGFPWWPGKTRPDWLSTAADETSAVLDISGTESFSER